MKGGHLSAVWLQALAAFASCLLATSLEAQSPIGSAFLVNPPSVGRQNQSDLQFDVQGNLWVAWTDSISQDGQDADFNRVMARHVTPQGELGPVLGLADTGDIPFTPVIAPLIMPRRDGSIELFYLRPNRDGFALVYGQRFSTAGDPQTARFLISPGPPWASGRTAAGELPNGGVFLANLGALCEICSKMKVSVYGRVLAPDDSLASPFFPIPSRLSGAPDTGVQSLAVD